MLFLTVGHTKNARDHLFNTLKKTYMSLNTFTMCNLLQKLNILNSVTVHPSSCGDFFDYTVFLGRWYKHLAGEIKTNHIFKYSRIDAQVVDRFEARIHQSDLNQHQAVQQDMTKKNFATNTGYPNYRDAVQARPSMIANAIATGLAKVTGVYLNTHKNIELQYKFCQFAPKEYRDDELYAKPDEEEMKMPKKEKAVQKDMRKKMESKNNRWRINRQKNGHSKPFKTMIDGVASGDLAAN